MPKRANERRTARNEQTGERLGYIDIRVDGDRRSVWSEPTTAAVGVLVDLTIIVEVDGEHIPVCDSATKKRRAQDNEVLACAPVRWSDDSTGFEPPGCA